MLNPAIRESSEATDIPPGRWQRWEMECDGCGQIHGLKVHLDEAIIENTPVYQDAREAMHAKLTRISAQCINQPGDENNGPGWETHDSALCTNCGHRRDWHYRGRGGCNHGPDGYCPGKGCDEFAEPEVIEP